MKKVKKKYGEPEEVNTYTSKNYKSEDWWYWSKGVKFGFVWGGSECECAKSKYTFDPIEKRVVTEEDRQRIESSKRIVSEEIIRQDDCIVCSQ